MKGPQFAVGGAQENKIQANRAEESVWRPGSDPGGDSIAFAESEEKVIEEIHGKDTYNRNRDTGKDAAPGKSDTKRSGNEDDDQTSPRQSESILKVRAEGGEQTWRKVGVVVKVFTQFGKTHKLGVHVSAAETKWCFAPGIDRDLWQHFAAKNIAGAVVVHYFYLLQLPRFYLAKVNGTLGEVIRDNVIMRVLLQNLDIIEDSVSGDEILNEPRACIRPVTENLTSDAARSDRPGIR